VSITTTPLVRPSFIQGSCLAHVPSRYEERAAETSLASAKQNFAQPVRACLWLVSIPPTRGDSGR